jgi:hypothetical protein
LENLNINGLDYTHHNYEKYLQHKYFLPEGEKNYFEHTRKNIIPTPISGVLGKGLFNIFPLSLDSDILTHSPSSNLGVISTSALRLELELEPVPQTVTWYLFYTFVYLNKITFQGSTVKQDVTVEYLK